MCRFTFSLTFILMSASLLAQNLPQGAPPASTSSGKPATLKEMRALKKQQEIDWSLQYIQVSYDVMPTGRWMLYPKQRGQEIQIGAKFYKYLFVLEGGYQDFTRKQEFLNYSSSGAFLRLGTDINLIKPKENNDGAISFGFRLAHSIFSDQIAFEEDFGFGERSYELQNKNANLTWLELTAGLDYVIAKNIHMGYLIRLKMFGTAKKTGTLEPFDIAGYGRYQKEAPLGFSYYIGWRLPTGKKKAIPKD